MVLDPFRWVSFPVLCPTTSRPYFSCKYWMQHFYKILISTSPRSHFFQSTECCGSDCPPDLSVVRMAVIRRSDLDGDRSCACLPEATRWRQATAMIRGWPRAVRIYLATTIVAVRQLSLNSCFVLSVYCVSISFPSHRRTRTKRALR